MKQSIKLSFEVEKQDESGSIRTYVFTVPYNCPSNEAIDALGEISHAIHKRIAEIAVQQEQLTRMQQGVSEEIPQGSQQVSDGQ